MAQTTQECEILGTEVLDVSDAEEVLEINEDNGDTEEGEIEKEPELLFEIHFQMHVFKKIGQHIQKALEKELKTSAPDKQVEFSFVEEGEKVIIRAINRMLLEDSSEKMESQTTCPPDISCTPDFSGIDHLFMVDTTPSEKLDAMRVPSYKRTIKEVLDDESFLAKKMKSEEEANKCPRVRHAASCFNCGSNKHGMRDCDRPRNQARINRAKKSLGAKQERYHVDIEQRFAHLRPGAISDKLKAALGLRGGELPFFFYRMRVLGYPPGWLEEAKVAHSGISLFNADGSVVLKSDEDEGEVDTMNHKYDVSKIVDFPGFNINPGPNYYDDHLYHNVPPMQKQQLKSEFIKTLGHNIIKGYKRKKLKDLPAVRSKDTVVEELMFPSLPPSDMEIEEPGSPQTGDVVFSRPPPPTESPKCATPPPPPPETSPPHSPNSPSLAELEVRQKQLMLALQANTSTVTDDSLLDDIMALDESSTSSLGEEANGKISPSANHTPSPTNAIDIPNVIKESHMGTPLLKFSPYDKLPKGDNFKVGVSDVINFENLPDSTGKYEHMRSVLVKVRQKLTKIHADE